MTVLTTIPNGASNKDIRDTWNQMLTDIVALKAAQGTAPALALSGPLTFTTSTAAGTLVANIGNVPSGVTPTITPNDGRLVVAGSQANGWTVVVGMTASSAGPIALSAAATGATGASATVNVTAAATAPAGFALNGANPRILAASLANASSAHQLWLDQGNSTSRGYPNGPNANTSAIASLVSARFVTAGVPSTANGMIGTGNGAAENRFTGWPAGNYGGGNQLIPGWGTYYSSTARGVFTPGPTFSVIDLAFASQGGGAITFDMGGAAPQSVTILSGDGTVNGATFTPANTTGGAIVRVTSATAVSALGMTGTDTTAIFYGVVRAFNAGTYGIDILTDAVVGSVATDSIFSQGPWIYTGDFIDLIQPNMVFINFGLNEMNTGVAVATYQSSLRAKLQRALMYCDPLAIFPHPAGGNFNNNVAAYIAAFNAVCAELKVASLNLYTYFGGSTTSGPLVGHYADTVHLDPTGYGLIATAVYQSVVYAASMATGTATGAVGTTVLQAAMSGQTPGAALETYAKQTGDVGTEFIKEPGKTGTLVFGASGSHALMVSADFGDYWSRSRVPLAATGLDYSVDFVCNGKSVQGSAIWDGMKIGTGAGGQRGLMMSTWQGSSIGTEQVRLLADTDSPTNAGIASANLSLPTDGSTYTMRMSLRTSGATRLLTVYLGPKGGTLPAIMTNVDVTAYTKIGGAFLGFRGFDTGQNQTDTNSIILGSMGAVTV